MASFQAYFELLEVNSVTDPEEILALQGSLPTSQGLLHDPFGRTRRDSLHQSSTTHTQPLELISSQVSVCQLLRKLRVHMSPSAVIYVFHCL
jgi:hypothetical protein